MSSGYKPIRGLYRTLHPLILASASPRRREMLRAIGLDFKIIPSGAEETNHISVEADNQVEEWAREKARAVSTCHPQSWVLGADTVVVLGGKIFGKPSTYEEAGRMLEKLSGQTHEVISAVCLAHMERSFLRVQSVKTAVRFRKLSTREIEAYIRTGEPMDKAGAYGIQGIGACLVQGVSGSYTNVVGLPLCETISWLLEQGVIEPIN